MRAARFLTGLTAAGGLLLALTGASGATAATPHDSLLAGERLTAGTTANTLVSANGNFLLTTDAGEVQLVQFTNFHESHGYSDNVITWHRLDTSGRPTPSRDRTVLLLKRDGNLVLRLANGTRVWASGTAGSGATRLRLTNGGNLVLLTAQGKQVWASGSGRAAVVAGETLASGARLVDALATTFGGKREFLTMQKDGNLVYTCGAKVRWQTHTHVAGSTLAITLRGPLRVLTPGGRTVWSSHNGTHSPTSQLNAHDAEFEQVSPSVRKIWMPAMDTVC